MTDGSKSLKALKSFVITPLIIKIIYSASDKHKKNNHKIEIRDIRNEREDRCLRVHTYVHENSWQSSDARGHEQYDQYIDNKINY